MFKRKRDDEESTVSESYQHHYPLTNTTIHTSPPTSFTSEEHSDEEDKLLKLRKLDIKGSIQSTLHLQHHQQQQQHLQQHQHQQHHNHLHVNNNIVPSPHQQHHQHHHQPTQYHQSHDVNKVYNSNITSPPTSDIHNLTISPEESVISLRNSAGYHHQHAVDQVSSDYTIYTGINNTLRLAHIDRLRQKYGLSPLDNTINK